MNENLQALYDALKGEYDLGTPEEFFAYLQDDGNREVFYEQIIQPQYEVESQDIFEQTYGLKKKDEGLPSTTPEEGVDLSTQESQEEFLSGGLSKDDVRLPDLQLRDEETVSDVLEKEVEEARQREQFKKEAIEAAPIQAEPEIKETAELESKPLMEGIEMEGARAAAEPVLIEKRKEEFEEEYLSKVEREKEKATLQQDEQFIQDIGDDFSKYFGMETDKAIRLLQNKYGKYGIRFEKDFKVDQRGKSVAVGNTIKAIAYNNKEYTIPLIQYQAGGGTMPQDFKAFIEENARLPKEKPTKAEELGMEVFGNIGVDYNTYKDMQDRYTQNLDLIEFLSAAPFKESELQESDSPLKYMDIVKDMYVGGVLRRDYKDFITKAKEDNKQIRNYLFSKDIVDTRYQLNLKLQNETEKVGAIALEYDANYKGMMQALEEETQKLFDIDIKDLESFSPTNYREREAKNIILKYYEEAKEQRKLAVESYALATSYWNEKTDKMLQGELVEGIDAWKNSLKVGIENGRAYNVLLPVMLGMTNINPDDTVDEVTLKVMEHLENADTGKFSVADREYFNARNNWEVLRALRNKPLDLMFAFAGQSIAQMLPIGSRLIPSAMAMGAGTGAGIGFAATGTPQAALAGAFRGFKEGASVGYAATNAAIEYITAFMEAANEKYDVSDGTQLEQALQDEEVYAYANDVGVKRGLTIGAVDYLGARFAGAFMPATKLARPAVRAALKVGERILVDPALEAFGEAMAQRVSGQQLEFKEILAEALGAIGNNAPFAVMNQMFTNQKNTVSDITKELTNLNTFIDDNSLDSQVLDWTNRQEKMGRIDSNQAQKIRDNVSVRSEAREILNVAENDRQKPSNNPEAEKRLANLLNAKRKLTSTETTQEAFSEQISAINKEIKEIARTGDVVAVEQQADISMLEAAPTEATPTEVAIQLTTSADEEDVVQDTEITEAAPTELTPEDKADIQQQVEDMKALFDEGEVRDIQREQVTEEALPTEVAPTEQFDEETVSKVRDIATRASKAISRVLPQTNIVLHDTQDDFQANTGSTGRGFFDPNTNTIHVNLTKATTTTVPHEVFHAVILNKIKTDTDVQNSVRNMVASVAKVVKKGTELSNKLDEFVALYESEGIGIMNEERLAELVGILSANYEQLTKPQKNIIIEFIRNIASKFGIKLPEGFGETDESVIDFLNTIARKTAIGEEITEVDIELLDVPSADGDVAVQPRVGREQIDADEVRSKYRGGSRISKGLSLQTKDNRKVYEETEALSREYVKEEAPQVYIKNASILAQEPIVKAVEDIKNIDSVEKADRVYNIFERQVADNLIFLTEQFEEYKDISSLWYDGANVLAQDLANKYGVSTEQVAGIIASMSPQKDWYQNVRLAELTLEVYQQNPVMTQEMVDLQREISSRGLKKKTGEKLRKATEQVEQLQSQLQSFVGVNLKDIPLDFQSYPVRLWNEINSSKDYDILRPDGQSMGKALSKVTGKPKKVAWGSYTEIGKAVSIYNDGSASNITRTLGLMHKIRNFYNNIIDPMSKDGDVTIDTHAVAAALLKPLSGNSKEVGQAFGTGSSSSNAKGIKGTYFAYADAYNLAAQELGLLPRQVQSITWEAVRGLFTDSYKAQKKNVESINDIWNRFENKEITYEEARNEVLEEAGGINRPSWAREVKREPDTERIDEPVSGERGRGRKVSDDVFRDDRRGREQLIAFPPNPSIDDIVRIGRSNGIKDDAIKIYLKDKGFSSTEINNALSVQVSSLQVMPKEFGNVEGGMNEGTKLFNQVRKKLSDFAKQEGRSSLIREKALDILKENPIFKKQDKAIQLELTLAMDRSLGIRSNPRVRQEIAEIRKRLAEIKKDKEFTEKAKRQVRAFIRKNLPVSRHYNKSKINKLIKQVSMATPTNIEGIFENIKSIIEDVRQKMKVDVINEIAKIAKDKAKIQRTRSGKRRSKGVDAIGQSYFSALNKVLNAVKKNDIDALQKMQDDIDNSGVDMQDVIERASNNEPITPKERTLLDKQLALDGFSDIVNLELEEVQEILKEVKAVRAESIARLNNRRQYRRAEVDGLKSQAQRQIRDDYKSFYDEQGNPYDREQIEARKNAVRNELKANGVFPALKVFLNQLGTKIDYSPNEMASFFRNNMYHLKTLLNIIDRGKEGFFTKYFWDNLSDADENTLRGVEDKTDVLDSIVNGVNRKNKKWSKWKYTLGEKVIKIDGIVNMKTGAKVSDAINKDQAMRIYALSLNDIQKNKLNKRGFTDKKIEKIKEFIGEDNVKIVDGVVSYLTNTYFDEINAVFEQLNDVSLGFVENYFPTSTISDISVDADLISNGNFSKVFDAENSPFTKDRIDTEGIIEYSLPFTEILEEYIKVMERYKNYAPMVRQMNEVLKDSEIKTVLEQTGTEGLFRQNLNYAINPNARASNYTSREIHHSVYNIAAGLALGLKPAQIYRQAMSFIQAFDEYKFLPNRRTPALDLIGFILDMGIVMATFPLQVLDFMKVSATFKNRIRMGLRGDIAGLEGNLRNYKPLSSKKNFGGRLLRATERLRGLYTVLGDLTGVIGYKAVYNRMIRNGVPKATALRIANRYNETQQSRRAMEMTPLQQDPRSLMKMITMFASTSMLQLNNVAQSLRSLLSDAGRFTKTRKKKDLPKLKDIRKLALNYALANMLWTASSYVFALTKGSDEDRDRALRAIKDSALGLTILERIPLLGFAITTLKNTLNGEPTFQSAGVNPYLIIFKNFQKEYKKVQETGEDLRMLIPIFETLVGMQFDSVIGIYNMLDGDISEEDMMDFLGVAPSYRPGYGSGKGLSYRTIMKEKLGKELFERLYGKKSSDDRSKSSREEVEERLKERDKRTGRRQPRN